MHQGYGCFSILVNFTKAVVFGAGYVFLMAVTASLLGFEPDTVVRDQPTHMVFILGVLLILEAPLTVFVVFKLVDGCVLAARIIMNRASKIR